MPPHRLAAGVRVGLVASATTAGVIVGLSLRRDSALRPFLLAGRAALLTTTGLLAPPLLATVLGVLVHTFWMMLWGVCFSVLATPLRLAQRTLAAIAVVALAGLLAWTIVPGALGAGAIAAQTESQAIFFLTLFALSLVAGIRLARE